MAKAKKLSGGVIFFLVIVFSVIGFAAGFWGYGFYGSQTPLKGDVLSLGGDLSVHFPELGNYKTGDCTLIKKGQTEVLIDAGASTSNIGTIDNYIKQFCEDGKLEFVIVTHAHEDHYAGFTTENSLFNRYEIGVIIEFAQVEAGKTEKAMYKNYVRERDEAVAAGAKCYTAKECRESGNYTFDLGGGATLTVLDSYYYYNVSTENNHSVCTLLTQGDYNFLFTGDLEKKGEEKLVEMNELPQVDLFKAGHHGSVTSSNDVLLSVIKPEIVCVCCCAGTSEYTDNSDNQFPSTEFINRVAPYTDKVYVTTVVDVDAEKTYKSMNGNIVATLGKNGVTVKCSDNDILLKDTEWFKANRVCPDAWKAA